MKETIVDLINVIRPKKSRASRKVNRQEQHSLSTQKDSSEEQKVLNGRSHYDYNQEWS